MIRTRSSLPPDLRRLIEASYRGAVENIGEEEFFYIGRNIERKICAVMVSSISWVQQLASYAEALHSVYQAHVRGEVELDDESLRHVGAALFYFVNPYDIIADHTPGKGYLDDAYVFNLCIKSLHKKYGDLLGKYLTEVVA